MDSDSTSHDVRITATLELGRLATVTPVRGYGSKRPARGSELSRQQPAQCWTEWPTFVHDGAMCTIGQTRKTGAKACLTRSRHGATLILPGLIREIRLTPGSGPSLLGAVSTQAFSFWQGRTKNVFARKSRIDNEGTGSNSRHIRG